MDFLILDEHSRLILRLWLSGRERLKNISPVRWASLKSASTAKIFHNELAEIIDCTGPKILDLLALPLDKKQIYLKTDTVNTCEPSPEATLGE